MTIEIRFIYLHRHQQHLTGSKLHLFVIFFAIDLPRYSDVTVNALNAQRVGHEMHGGIELVGG